MRPLAVLVVGAVCIYGGMWVFGPWGKLAGFFLALFLGWVILMSGVH